MLGFVSELCLLHNCRTIYKDLDFDSLERYSTSSSDTGAVDNEKCEICDEIAAVYCLGCNKRLCSDHHQVGNVNCSLQLIVCCAVYCLCTYTIFSPLSISFISLVCAAIFIVYKSQSVLYSCHI